MTNARKESDIENEMNTTMMVMNESGDNESTTEDEVPEQEENNLISALRSCMRPEDERKGARKSVKIHEVFLKKVSDSDLSSNIGGNSYSTELSLSESFVREVGGSMGQDSIRLAKDRNAPRIVAMASTKSVTIDEVFQKKDSARSNCSSTDTSFNESIARDIKTGIGADSLVLAQDRGILRTTGTRSVKFDEIFLKKNSQRISKLSLNGSSDDITLSDSFALDFKTMAGQDSRVLHRERLPNNVVQE